MKRLYYALLFVLSTGSAFCQQGKVMEHISMSSNVMKTDVHYTIYLPPDYEYSQRSYPVVYLFHGFTDDDRAWVQFGEVNRYADKAIESGEIPPMIIVTPDAGVTWYMNNFDGSVRFEDFFITEFIPYIDSTYRTKQAKEFRGISGLSMGGNGALLMALKHPDLFAACAALSAGIRTDDEIVNTPDDRYERTSKNLYAKAGTKGKDRLTGTWYNNSVLKIMETKPVEEIKKVRWYIDCGDGDFLYKGNSTLHILMRDREIPHEYRVRDGEHNWTYWRTGITNALDYIGTSFRR